MKREDRIATSTSMPVDAKGDEEGAALGMAARSQGLVRMMTQTTTTHPRGVNWKGLESGKL